MTPAQERTLLLMGADYAILVPNKLREAMHELWCGGYATCDGGPYFRLTAAGLAARAALNARQDQG